MHDTIEANIGPIARNPETTHMTSGEQDQIPEISQERMEEHGNALNNLRGVVMTAYAQVEFHLADLAIRCSYLDCYRGVVPKFPRKLDDRINAIRRLASMDGPLARYRVDLEIAIDHIKVFTPLRNLMGHAMAQLDVSPTNHIIHFEMFDIVEKGQLRLIKQDMTLDILDREVNGLVLYTHTMLALFRRIRSDLPARYSDQGPIPDAWSL